MESPASPEPAARTRPPRFDPPNILWYFGAISATVAAGSVISATGAGHHGLWIFLVALGFLAGAAGLAAAVLRSGCWVPGGVLTASAVTLVPAVVVGLEHLIRVWPRHPSATDPFHDFEGFAFVPVLLAVAGGLVAYRFVRFAFVLLPVVIASALAIQLLLPALVSAPGLRDHVLALLFTGAGFVVLGMLLDARIHRRAAFWWHVIGLLALANGLFYYVGVNPFLPGHHSSWWAWLTMLVLGAALLVAAVPVGRATWGAFGVAGIYAPALHYVSDASGGWRYPLLMVFVGVGLMFVGAFLDIAGASWPQRLARPGPPPA